ncbi:carboxylesterase/lipase family protein [Agromyces sp. SYSU K20354]|uniref:carboxylesterase/lipase family protein n=1 Tax=Agromyces cavernae TaxID=2898659 RepID=UPI001E335C0C|nr:carboxylesterase/lipase family protein [Agromyces cavernae]MCD2443044.1 carboxylesterase/lipase family protein [Agromyces cavernae]
MTAHAGTDDGLDVRVTGGVARGVREGEMLAWRGMPYAAPPTGDLRFRAPAPVLPWIGVRNASAFGAVAPQHGWRPRLLGAAVSAVTADEDCLTVNVSAPVREADGVPLPVMVFIHGGGYSAGSSRDFSGQGEGFVRSGRVVYVSFNYRLGALGYLDFTRYTTDRRRFDSNLGLRDQIALLAWVRENIAAFGGDAARVTVFGESAGGNAVTTLMATPSARELFAGAIAQSPPPDAVYERKMTARWAAEYVALLRGVVSERDEKDAAARETAPGAGVPPTPPTPQQLLADASADDLVAASVALQVRTPDAYAGAFCFAPVIDGDIVPERPFVAFREGRSSRVPLIIGTNDREGSIFRGRGDILPRTEKRISEVFARAPGVARRAMREAYPELRSSRRAAADFGGDYGFWYPSTRVADTCSRHAPVWSYRFDFAPRLLKLVGLDATHGVEMFALFNQIGAPMARFITSLGGYEEYAAAGERMRQHWLHFAETGTPGPQWPRYDEQARSTLVIDATDRVEADPRSERRRAWDAFTPSLSG